MPVRSRFARPPARAPPSVWNSLRHGMRFMSKPAILVVDDEAEIREGLRMLLGAEGYEVVLAENAEAGLKRVDERPFDLLLLDVSLPDGNGLELLKEVRRRD